MKRGLLAATLMVTAAGVASANLLTTATQNATPQTVARQTAPASLPRAQPVTPVAPVAPAIAQAPQVVPAPPRTASAPTAAPAAGAQKPLIEMRQAPVPLLVKPRPAVNLPAADAKSTDAKSTDAKTTDAKAGETPPDQPATDDSTAEKAAKAAIEADGYKGVKVLRKGANGVWHATALRGRTTVMLTVDAGGSVTAD